MITNTQPLADKLRPKTLDEFVGQDHLVGEGRLLKQTLEKDLVPSLIFWGPPGSGKTTLAAIIARASKSHFIPMSAVTAGVADLKKAIEAARQRQDTFQQKTILFIDEIHRFNKAQQDYLLPHVEQGTITFIGATTENPSFEVNAPLLSRSRVLVLNRLGEKHLQTIIQRAMDHLGQRLQNDAMQTVIALSNGDARIAITTLEIAAQFARKAKTNRITKPMIEEAAQQKALQYDRAGEEHYNTISAFIKSMRASDPDAALYWLARMLEAGEDPLFIARRMVVFASEDIGNADPQALQVAVAVQQAVHFVGLPEGRINLYQGTTYLASAPKSRASYDAGEKATHDAKEYGNVPVPMHLRNAPTELMKELGYGKQRKDEQDNRPREVSKKRYYIEKRN